MRNLLITLACIGAFQCIAAGVDYPGTGPGRAVATISENAAILENAAITANWGIEDGRLRLVLFKDRLDMPGNGTVNGEAFVIHLKNGRALRASDFTMPSAPRLERISGRSDARRLAERHDGVRVNATLSLPDEDFTVEWGVELRDGSNYIIQRITLVPATHELPLESVTLVDLNSPEAKVFGATQGAPVVAGSLFFALEHPMSESTAAGGRITCGLRRAKPLAAGGKLTLSSVMGTTPPGQLRRGYLHYLERERAHPYRPFLHYNSWYDIAWGDRKFGEAEALGAIEAIARELIVNRGVRVDSFVFDDGWDDNETLWKFHGGFPNGFAPLRKSAELCGSSVGTWLSPFGGYGEAREQRLKFGIAQGYEVNRNGFSLAGARYYARFREICAEMMREYGVNFFKFDGMGPGNNSTSGQEFLEDIEALMRLTGELRELNPDLYVSATTGTWCSPYFLWHADSVWRGADDMNFCGKGSKRQQWINYRDTHTHRNVVLLGPLYPLNSLMTQGIVHGRHGYAALMDESPKDFADEVWSFFGSGTSLQELYITPEKFTGAMWDILAAGAWWARTSADVLADAHWIGGDPGENQVYGWASWSRRKGILVLRNPDDKPAEISLDLQEAFELPPGAAQKYSLISPVPGAGQMGAIEAIAGTRQVFQLEAFQTIVFDALPDTDGS